MEDDPKARDDDVEELMPRFYDELRRVASRYMSREHKNHTLQPTAVVNEAYLRLAESEAVSFENDTHFKALVARTIRRVLIDHARSKLRLRRGGGQAAVPLRESVMLDGTPGSDPIDLLALDDALSKLETMNPRHARVVEMRFFAGMTVEQTATELGVSRATAENDWRFAKMWLAREMGA